MLQPEVLNDLMEHDDRCRALSFGLQQLAPPELARLDQHLVAHRPLVLDEVHYDERTQLWCPLAIGIGVPELLTPRERTRLNSRRGRDAVRALGRDRDTEFSLNPVRLYAGDFYRHDRYRDLANLVAFLVLADVSAAGRSQSTDA
jgi:hypothetical protein